jgi:hypothetical protein
MPALYLIANGTVAASADINQVVNTLSANQNTPVSIINTDPIAYTLQLKNTDAAGKALLIYASDGSTVLARVQGTGMVVSPDGTAAAPVVSTTHTQTLTNKTLTSPTLTTPLVSSGGLQVASGNVGIGGAPLSNVGLLTSGASINASGGSAQALNAQATLVAQANTDNLIALYINPTFNDNGKTGVGHYGVYSAVGLNYFAGNVGIGIIPATSAVLRTGGTITAVAGNSAIAYFAGTLAAAANNDLLGGVQVAPTFTPGAFTGLSMNGIYVAPQSAAQASAQSFGIQIGSVSGANTNNYGLYVSNPSGASGENMAIKCLGAISIGGPSIAGASGYLTIGSTQNVLGGGATATLGTIGGSGPTVAGQNSWLRFYLGISAIWVPVWV